MSQFDVRGRSSALLNLAAVAVILASVTAVAAVTGLLPSAFSNRSEGQVSLSAVSLGAAARIEPPLAVPCRQCGVIETVREVTVKGHPSGLTGSIVSSQFGRGNARHPASYAEFSDVAASGLGGREDERNASVTTTYRIVVRMDDGSARTVYQSATPVFGVGEKVRVNNGVLAAGG